jgi:hypothetical protein
MDMQRMYKGRREIDGEGFLVCLERFQDGRRKEVVDSALLLQLWSGDLGLW